MAIPADCKSVAYGFEGSSPSSSTTKVVSFLKRLSDFGCYQDENNQSYLFDLQKGAAGARESCVWLFRRGKTALAARRQRRGTAGFTVK